METLNEGYGIRLVEDHNRGWVKFSCVDGRASGDPKALDAT
jgi:hypothetical protein